MKLQKFASLLLLAGSLSIPAFAGSDDNKPPTPPTTPPPATKPDDVKEGKKGVEVPREIHIPKALESQLDDATKALIEKLRTATADFVAGQQELVKKLKGATAEDKAAIKEQLKANKDKFLADTAQLRTDIREKIKELKATLKDQKPIDPATGTGNGGGRKGGN